MTGAMINVIAQQAYQNCLRACETFEVDYLTELLAKDPAQRWWRDTFCDHSEELAQRIKDHLLEAQLTEAGCLALGQTSNSTNAQRVHWRGRRQKIYQLVAWGLSGKIPGKKSVVRHLCNTQEHYGLRPGSTTERASLAIPTLIWINENFLVQEQSA